MSKYFLLAFVLFVGVHGQDSDSTFIRYIVNQWNGQSFAPQNVTPVILSVENSDDKQRIVVCFKGVEVVNGSSYSLPSVYGVMFKGDNDAILQIETHSTSSQRVELYKGFLTQLFPKETLAVDMKQHNDQRTWNLTLSIPVNYFPRDTNSIAAYANYSQSTPQKMMIVLTLNPITGNESSQTTVLPNLYQKSSFQEANFHKYLNNPKFGTEWSEMWQELLQVTPGGTSTNETKPSTGSQRSSSPNDASLIEKGLISWIIASAVFCGILHVFVLSL